MRGEAEDPGSEGASGLVEVGCSLVDRDEDVVTLSKYLSTALSSTKYQNKALLKRRFKES